MSFRDAAAKWKLNKDQLYAHYSEHIPDALRATLAKSEEAKLAAKSIDIADQLFRVNQVANHIMAKSVRSGEDATALQAAETIKRQLELHGKLFGDLRDSPTFNVLVMPEFATAMRVIFEVLVDHPALREAISSRLQLLRGAPANEDLHAIA